MNARTLNLKHLLIAAGLILAVPLAAQARPMMDGKGYCDRPMPAKMQEGFGKHGGMQAGKHGGMHGGKHMGLRGLNLSEEQRDKIFTLMHEQAPVMREKAKVARNARSELRALSQAEQFDAERAKALTDAAAQAHAEMDLLRAQTRHALSQVLTPEQRQQWQERQDRFQRGDWGNRGGQRGEGLRQRQG